MPELIVIVAVILIIRGPATLPRLGSALGSAVRNFKKGSEAPPALSSGGEAISARTPSS